MQKNQFEKYSFYFINRPNGGFICPYLYARFFSGQVKFDNREHLDCEIPGTSVSGFLSLSIYRLGHKDSPAKILNLNSTHYQLIMSVSISLLILIAECSDF